MTPIAGDLERRIFRLETLYDIGRECAAVHTVPEIVRVILSMLMGAFGALRGAAWVGEPSGRIQAIFSRGLRPAEREASEALARSFLTGCDVESEMQDLGMALALPFELDARSRGAIVLGAKLTAEPYSSDDRALLETIVANSRSFLHNARLLEDLQQTADELRRKVQALAVANDIALGMAARPSARRLQQRLVERIGAAMDAEEVALGLSGPEGWRVAARYSSEQATSRSLPDDELLASLAASAADGEAGPGRVVAVRGGNGAGGALWLRRDRPFASDEQALLEFLANQTSIILENSRLLDGFLVQQQEQFRLRGMLEQYLAPGVAERLISGETRPSLEGTKLRVTVLMADMRGSTELINHVEPEVMVRLLNEYLGRITDVLFHHEGTIDKFEGDAVLGFFGAPEHHEDDPLRALRAGADMQRSFAALLAEWRERYPLPRSIGMGIGIATGDVVVGNIGSAKRMDHTIIGPSVNLAARLTARAPAGSIQLDEATWSTVRSSLGPSLGRDPRPRHLRLKGFDALVPTYRLPAAHLLPLS